MIIWNGKHRNAVKCSCGTRWLVRKVIPTFGRTVSGYWCPRCDVPNESREITLIVKGNP